MASFNEDPADRAAELERMLVGHECTLETAFGFYTLGDCRYAIGDYKGAHEAWKTLHEANVTNALTDQALFQDGRALDASGAAAPSEPQFERTSGGHGIERSYY